MKIIMITKLSRPPKRTLNGIEKSKSKTIKSLERIRRWWTEDGVPTWLVIYPEGTRFDPDDKEKIAKSKGYAEEKGLRALEVRC